MVEEQIVGKWNWYNITYDFHRDGTYDYVNTDSGVRTNGRYCIEGNIIKFFIGGVVTSEFSLIGDKLELAPRTPQRGDFVTFTRVG